jgi:hypothetical protein
MRIRMWAAGSVAAAILQGCVETNPVMPPGAQQNLQSLQLFNADASPRFTFYLACTSDTVKCITIEKAFDEWADERHVSLHRVETDDGSFQNGRPSRPHDQVMPYRVAVHYAPWIKPSYTTTTLGSSGGSYPPLIGYSATIYVFDAATGKLLQTLPARAEQSADSNNGPANPYLRAEVRSFLASLDPAYAKR